MSNQAETITGGLIFDGTTLHTDQAARFDKGIFTGLIPQHNIAHSDTVIDLEGDILSPAYVDLQVNGGGGVMFNEDPSTETLACIATAHRELGTHTILPTLITDTPNKTRAAIAAVQTAVAAGVPGIAGLHLEGPHLSIAKKGAHDAGYIRPMDNADLELLVTAKRTLPVLKVTIAPENVTLAQVAAMAKAGLLVSLGHTDADYETCKRYNNAGARCATHLFNAMSQLGAREPGLVGAAIDSGQMSAGLIADGIHVHPSSMRIAFTAKQAPGRIYLVSDAMAVAGSDRQEFHLDGRLITRNNGRLTLQDGTLAGADLDLTTAIRVLRDDVGIPLDSALQAATTVPAALIGMATGLQKGSTTSKSMIRIANTLTAVQSMGTV
jgi:N-acetylglucosamine-6-phosphate deacetylase